MLQDNQYPEPILNIEDILFKIGAEKENRELINTNPRDLW